MSQLRYCLTRECLQNTLTTTPPLSRRSIAVRKSPVGIAADPAAEDDLDVVRPADAQVVGDQRLEEAAGAARARRTRWCGRPPPAASRSPTSSRHPGPAAERQRQPVQPPLGEHLDGPGPSRSQIACSAAGSSQEANPLDSAVKPIPALAGLALGPLDARNDEIVIAGSMPSGRLCRMRLKRGLWRLVPGCGRPHFYVGLGVMIWCLPVVVGVRLPHRRNRRDHDF